MLTKIPGSKFAPYWSPNGESIAFVIEDVGPRANIFKVDLDGNNLRRLTVGPKVDGRPAFSPDGSKLAFESNRAGNYEIYVNGAQVNQGVRSRRKKMSHALTS